MSMNHGAPHELTARPVVLAVSRCVEICLERRDGYTRAAEDVSETGLGLLLADFAEERGQQAQAFLSINEPTGSHSHSGIRTRRSGPGLREPRTVLDECIVGDEASRIELQEVFVWAPLIAMPMDVRTIMLSTYCATLRVLSQLRKRLARA